MLHILILITALQPAFAKFSTDYSECERVLTQVEVSQPKATPAFDRTLSIGLAEMAEIETLAQSEITHAELLKKAFEVYVLARLKNVPTIRAAKAYDALSRISNRVITYDYGSSGGTYWSEENEIGVPSKIPVDSVIYYRTLAHELEHSLQKFGPVDELTWLVKSWAAKKKYGSTKDEWWPWYTYYKELEAVRAEYDFLRLLPERAMLGDSHGEIDQTETMWYYARSGDFRKFHELSSYPSIYSIIRAYRK